MSINLSQKTRLEIAQQVIDMLEHRAYRKVLVVEEVSASSVILHIDDGEKVPVSGFVAEKILGGQQ